MPLKAKHYISAYLHYGPYLLRQHVKIMYNICPGYSLEYSSEVPVLNAIFVIPINFFFFLYLVRSTASLNHNYNNYPKSILFFSCSDISLEFWQDCRPNMCKDDDSNTKILRNVDSLSCYVVSFFE